MRQYASLIAVGAVAVFLVFVMCWAYANQYDEFMVDCTAHHPRYECTALWRAGEHPIQQVQVIK